MVQPGDWIGLYSTTYPNPVATLFIDEPDKDTQIWSSQWTNAQSPELGTEVIFTRDLPSNSTLPYPLIIFFRVYILPGQ